MTVFQSKLSRSAFTLIEVVLALGVFFISILALIGLLSPMLKSVDEVEKIDEITSVVNTANAFLQGSPKIASVDEDGNDITAFEAVYKAVADGNEASLFVYRYYEENGAGEDRIRLETGFSESEGDFVGEDSVVNSPDANGTAPSFGDAAGPIYRVVLTASSVTPEDWRSGSRDATTGIYTLTEDFAEYPEGYLALEARIFAEDPPGPSGEFDTTTDLTVLSQKEHDFTFNTAIVR